MMNPDERTNGEEHTIKRHNHLLIGVVFILTGFLMYLVRDTAPPIIVLAIILLMLFPHRKQSPVLPLFWTGVAVLVGMIWAKYTSLFAPFLIALIIAYALDPVVDGLTRRRCPRPIVILVMVVAIIGTLVGLGFLIIPQLISQAAGLASQVPQWGDQLGEWARATVVPYVSSLTQIGAEEILDDVQARFVTMLQSRTGELAEWSLTALGGVASVVGGLVNLLLIPILSVYFLLEYKIIRASIYSSVPTTHRQLVLKIYREVNNVLTGYVHGVTLVILFLATWIGLGLWLIADLPYALLLGLMAGVLSLIPYVGITTATLLILVVAITQPDPIITTIKTAAVLISAQFLEGNFITPRLVGDRVKLHPVVIIFLFLLFAKLFGVVGMLLAIPLGASIAGAWRVWSGTKKEASPAKEH